MRSSWRRGREAERWLDTAAVADPRQNWFEAAWCRCPIGRS